MGYINITPKNQGCRIPWHAVSQITNIFSWAFAAGFMECNPENHGNPREFCYTYKLNVIVFVVDMYPDFLEI